MNSSRTIPVLLLAIVTMALGACSHGINRDQVIANARAYNEVRWMPEARHIRHGSDGIGQWVHTPDSTLVQHNGDPRGWWHPGVEAVGMPYKWGGFDTPASFTRKIRRGYFAGDIATAEKKRLLEAAVSRRATGVDCSGFVSRCWGLRKHYSTRTLHQVSHRLDCWGMLLPGDILLNHGHVMIFSRWTVPGSELMIYEAGTYPTWKTGPAILSISTLEKSGYAPWRYNHIRD